MTRLDFDLQLLRGVEEKRSSSVVVARSFENIKSKQNDVELPRGITLGSFVGAFCAAR